MATIPSSEGVAYWMDFKNKEDEINNSDFADKIESRSGVLESLAKFKKQTLKEYKSDVVKKLRKKALSELLEKYYPEQVKTDKKQNLLDKYQQMSDKLVTDFKPNIADLLKKPDSLK